jgi:hypothetical protein
VRTFLPQNAQVHSRPRTERSPVVGYLVERGRRAVALGHFGVESALAAWQCIGRIGSSDHDELGGEGTEPLDLTDGFDSVVGIGSAQRCPVENAVERSIGDRVQVLALAAGQIEVELS